MIKTFSRIDVGKKRKLNQDYVFVSEKQVGNLPNLFVVADGMGGHKAGGVASYFAVNKLVELIKNCKLMEPEQILQETIKEVNRELYKQSISEKELNGMGTTLVVCTIVFNYLYVFNVGDSRLYVINKEIKQITTDHSYVEELLKYGEFYNNILKTSNIKNKNIITRAIGTEKEVEVDIFERRIRNNDIILMCTDGLTNMIEDSEIFRIANASRDVVEIANELVELANNNGGNDNIGIIVIEPKNVEENKW